MRRSRFVARVAPALFFFVIVGACGPAVDDQPRITESTQTIDTTQQGALDPAANFARWPDDEIFVATPPLSTLPRISGFYEPRPDLSALDLTEDTAPTLALDVVDAEAGRFLAPDRDSVVLLYRDPTYSTFLDVTFYKAPGFSTALKSLAPRQAGSSDFFDSAAGDLDGFPVTDEAGDIERRDELVVAWANPPISNLAKGQVAVLGFEPGSPPVSHQTTTASTSQSINTSGAPWNVVAVAVGDFDGEADPRFAAGGRIKELAVAYVAAKDRMHVDVFRYTATYPSPGVIVTALSLTASADVLLGAAAELDSVSAVAGDFDGDGRDELALGTTHHVGLTSYVDVRLFRIAGPTITQAQVIVPASPAEGSGWRIQLAAGNFTFDANPTLGWVPQRKQLALAFGNGKGAVQVKTMDLDTALAPTQSAPFTTTHAVNVSFALATGGFRGSLLRPPTDTAPNDPTWSLGLMTWDASAWTISVLQPGRTTPGGAKPAPVQKAPLVAAVSSGPAAGARMPFIAADRDGNTIYLGAPVHFTLSNVVETDFILEEPPKHTYWDNESRTVQNVSRWQEFNLSLVQSETSKFSYSGKDTVSYAVGGSLSASASATVSAGANIGIAKAKASATTEISATVGYDYDNTESTISASTGSKMVETTLTTAEDDAVVVRVRNIDIWRYRVFGATPATDPEKPFFDFVLPASRGEIRAEGDASRFPWYQPRHENGNVLSYPTRYDPAFDTPPEQGSVLRNGALFTSAIYGPEELSFGGTSGGKLLQFGETEEDSVEFSYSHKITASASIKESVSAEASAFGVGVATSGSLAFEAHGNYSWGESGTHSTSTSSSTGFTLNQISRDSGEAYVYYPKIYATGDGTIKAAYATEVERAVNGDGWQFWLGKYGTPDLALNLPRRFKSVTSEYGVYGWAPRWDAVRKELRGFFVRKQAQNPVTGEYDLLPTAAVPDPATVRLQARVYNYSVGANGTVQAGAKACFHRIPMNALVEEEAIGPATLIDCAVLPLIPPRGMAVAEVLWDTTGAALGTLKDYRIYVRLDPDGVVAETYDTAADGSEKTQACDVEPCICNASGVCIYPGQNNEGYATITVASRGYAAPPGAGWKRAHVGLGSVAGIDRRGVLASGNLRVLRDEVFDLRVIVTSDKRSMNHSYVVVFDGDPDRGGKVVGMKPVYVGNDDPAGTAVWFDWIPKKVGPHRLYVKVLQTPDDSAPGGNVGVLKVEVVPAPPGLTR